MYCKVPVPGTVYVALISHACHLVISLVYLVLLLYPLLYPVVLHSKIVHLRAAGPDVLHLLPPPTIWLTMI